MAITLVKGGNISLTKTSPGLSRIFVGLGWNARTTDGTPFDLDASLFMLKADGKVRSEADFIFYNQLKSPDGSVEHLGDNLTGDGDGDDEVINIDLTKVPTDVEKLVVGVTINGAEINFGMVNGAFVRVVNDDTKAEIVRYDLSEDFSIETAVIFGEVYRYSGEWKFKAIGQGWAGGLAFMAKTYGVVI